MKLAKTLVIVATAAVFVTSVATAGAATRQQDRQRLKDATCTSQTCTPVGDAVKARHGQKANKAAGQNGGQSGQQARQRRKAGSCTTVAGVQLRTGARDRLRSQLNDGSCLNA
jgi:hypothetical protein